MNEKPNLGRSILLLIALSIVALATWSPLSLIIISIGIALVLRSILLIKNHRSNKIDLSLFTALVAIWTIVLIYTYICKSVYLNNEGLYLLFYFYLGFLAIFIIMGYLLIQRLPWRIKKNYMH